MRLTQHPPWRSQRQQKRCRPTILRNNGFVIFIDFLVISVTVLVKQETPSVIAPRKFGRNLLDEAGNGDNVQPSHSRPFILALELITRWTTNTTILELIPTSIMLTIPFHRYHACFPKSITGRRLCFYQAAFSKSNGAWQGNIHAHDNVPKLISAPLTYYKWR